MTTTLEKPARLPVPPRPRRPRAQAAGWIIAAVVVAAHVVAWNSTGMSFTALVEGRDGMADFLAEAFPPDLSWDVLQPSLSAALVTLWIGLLGTTLSVPASLLLGLLAARTTAPAPWVYQATRSLLSFLRAVPDVVFALIFVTAVGLGPFPGVLALLLHNIGVMGKLWAEAIEDADPGPSQVLRSAGASRAQIAAHALLPTVTPQLTGLLMYRLDVNVRSSLVLGLVGAGGIGFLINQSIKLFQFDEMLTHILVVLVLVVVVDRISAAVRRRLS
ncbi:MULTISPECIES: phosphonate ABC transporter, permease protein PhnE [unclassified Streptomyces]|uniref:Phosphonate ABC transporter, permease protein PhnE n=1 Tax=Streptomyces evansiae TaxID=3075535 RepID=A0ABU2R757_9ACTN|nr:MULTISPECIES: phosphonate ABC transporter, permease protein PhnE [unclassified Streptomyces]MDT0412207.1 phosphonate ABC transporter, permease protein PhnE [Streptomyces sp. DSM 41979]MYQ56167.1 phosphonate ABC transporter, permease protein PhnE [Streptomyces sp. SID4926]SCD95943.1 phosphonate transport system permease protein [Streptomyces sp. DfronAA-171]